MLHEVTLAEQYRRQMVLFQQQLADLRKHGCTSGSFIMQATLKRIKEYRKLYRETG